MATRQEEIRDAAREWVTERGWFFEENTAISVGIVLALIFLCIVPIVAILYSSLTAEGLRFTTGEFTLRNWYLLAGQASTIQNTIVYSVGTAILATAVATFLAWIISRTNTPLRNLYFYLVFGAFFVPPVIWERFWINLWGRNGIVPTMFGVSTFHIQSIPGMIVVQTVRLVPLGLIILMPLLRNFDKSLEEMSFLSGSGIRGTAKDITLPILTPGIATCFVLVLILTLASFRVPLIIGLPVGINVLPTQIYLAASDSPVQYGVAMADALMLIAISLPLLYIYKRVRGRSEKYTTVTGKGHATGVIDLGWWRYPLSGVVALYLLIGIIIPTFMMVYASFLEFYVPPRLLGTSKGFTLAPYLHVFGDPTLHQAVLNSFLVALVASVLSIVFGLVIAWVLSRDLPFGTSIDYLSFTPMAIPSIALALGLMFVYLNWVTIGLYGTLGIIIVAYLTRTLPVSVRIINPAVIQIDRSLLEMGQIAGLSRTRRIGAIILPLIVGTLQALFVTMFAFLYFEFPIALLLSGHDLPLVSSQLYLMQIEGFFTQTAALGTLVMAGLIAFTAVTAKARSIL